MELLYNSDVVGVFGWQTFVQEALLNHVDLVCLQNGWILVVWGVRDDPTVPFDKVLVVRVLKSEVRVSSVVDCIQLHKVCLFEVIDVDPDIFEMFTFVGVDTHAVKNEIAGESWGSVVKFWL